MISVLPLPDNPLPYGTHHLFDPGNTCVGCDTGRQVVSTVKLLNLFGGFLFNWMHDILGTETPEALS
jgi:hypothetical protein